MKIEVFERLVKGALKKSDTLKEQLLTTKDILMKYCRVYPYCKGCVFDRRGGAQCIVNHIDDAITRLTQKKRSVKR